MPKVKAKAKRPALPRGGGRRRSFAVGGLGLAAAAYVGVDYLRHLSPAWHGRLQPALWAALALATAARAPFYRRWDVELRAAPRFLAALAFMLAAFLCEAISVRFVNTVLGLEWHRSVLSRLLGRCRITLRHYCLAYSCTNVGSGYTYDGVYFVLSA
jgi:hypothetical protein